MQTTTGTELARPLKVLVPLIKDDLTKGKEAAEKAGVPYYQAAGAKMAEARPQMNGLEFKSWLKRNFNLSLAHAYTYMSLDRATRGKQIPAAAEYKSLREFEREHLKRDRPKTAGGIRQPGWRKDVDSIAESTRKLLEKYKTEEFSRQQERETERKLAEKLIDIGYRVLAKELHPDKGGSRDAMQRLVRVRDRLKSHA